jgi:hypothetical protein
MGFGVPYWNQIISGMMIIYLPSGKTHILDHGKWRVSHILVKHIYLPSLEYTGIKH